MKMRLSIRISALVAALISSGVGAFTLVAWILGRWKLAPLGENSLFMAPIHGLLLITLSGVLVARLLWPASRLINLGKCTALSLTTCLTLAELLRSQWAVRLHWDSWHFGLTSEFAVAFLGRMNPFTSVVLLLAVLSLWTQGTWFARFLPLRQVGALATAAGLLIGAVGVLAHATGTPLGYQSGDMLLTLPAALALTALFTSLILIDHGNQLRRLWQHDERSQDVPGQLTRFFTPSTILALTGLVIAIGGAGIYYLRNVQTEFREGIDQRLHAIASLKVEQIAAWQHERLADAAVAATAPNLAEFLAQPDPASESQSPRWVSLNNYLETLRATYDYRQIVLINRKLEVVATFPFGTFWDHSLPVGAQTEISQATEPITMELHHGRGADLHLDLISPLRNQRDGNFEGAILLRVDMNKLLLPFLEKWPASGTTGKTLLVQRDGDAVIFVNHLHQDGDSDLPLRLPLSSQNLLSAKALTKKIEGVYEGINYRGAPALGYAIPIRGTAWTIIAEIERAEAFVPAAEKSRQILIALALILILVGVFVRSWWHQTQQRSTQRQLAAERSAHAASKRLSLVMRHANDAILLFDDTLHIVEANDTAIALYGRTLPEMQQLTARDLSTEIDAGRTSLDFSKAMAPEGTTFKTFHRRKDGTSFPVEVSASPLELEGRHHVLSILRDITEQVKARERLEHFNAELEATVARRTEEIDRRNRESQAVLQSIPDLVMRLRTDATLLDLKPAKGACPLSAIARPEGENPPAPALSVVQQAVLPLGRRALKENTTIAAEVELVIDQTPVTTELRVAPVGAGEFVVFARDITERKKTEAAMVAMLEKERQVSEMKSRFISVTSHEFRTPMAAAMASADLLRNHHDKLAPGKREELSNRIVVSLQRMTQMLDEVLLLNLIEAKRVEVNLTPVDLRDFAYNVIEEIRLGDRDAHRFTLDATGLANRFPADTNLLHHILGNLLSNAVRYSPLGTVIALGLDVGPDQARISVTDHGIGVPEADRSRIFESFERGSNIGTIKGTGLGLNIVKRMTDLLHGDIALESPPEGGSRFVLTLPRSQLPPVTASP